VAVTLAVIGVFAYDVVQDVREHNVAFARNEIRFGGYDAMTQQIQDMQIKLTILNSKIDLLLENSKKGEK
jgi:hypothetical protein